MHLSRKGRVREKVLVNDVVEDPRSNVLPYASFIPSYVVLNTVRFIISTSILLHVLQIAAWISFLNSLKSADWH